MRLAPLALLAACAGCAVTTPAPPLRIAPAAAPERPWWQDAGDPLLVQLIRQGLAHDPALACRAADLAERERQAHARRIRARLTRLIDHEDAAARTADFYALAAARSRLATRIALAYVEARRWQERITLRAQALDPLRDNAEIARFRREAGLAPALDGDMADVITGLDTASLDTARAHLADAIAELSRLTGALPEDLRVLLGPDGHVPLLPDPAGGPVPPAPAGEADLSHRADLLALQARLGAALAHQKITQAALDAALDSPLSESGADTPAARALAPWRKEQARARAELAAAAQALEVARSRFAALDQTEALALRAAGDARLAYRNGMSNFATLYVAEGAALAARERRVDTKAAVAGATIALRDAQGLGWQQSDLTPAPGAAPGTTCVQP